MQGLEGIANELEIEYLAHRSDEDARVTLEVLKHMCKQSSLTFAELVRKCHVTSGENTALEITPCTDGTYTHKEINYLTTAFMEKVKRHSWRYKGGLSTKTFAFCEKIRFGDLDLFRRILKRIYDLNGRFSSIETSNVFVYIEGEVTDREKNALESRNRGKKRISEITLDSLLGTLGELPEIDFSSDVELIKKHRLEIKRQREIRRLEKRKEIANRKIQKSENEAQ